MKLGSTLIDAKTLEDGITRLAAEIERDQAGRPVLLVGILKGSIFFLCDLAKKLDKDNPDLVSAPLDQLRQRIADLARGTAEPVFKNILEYTSMKVTRIMPRKVK